MTPGHVLTYDTMRYAEGTFRKMKQKKEKLIIDGNALYEIDLECLEKKRRKQQDKKKNEQQKRQRN